MILGRRVEREAARQHSIAPDWWLASAGCCCDVPSGHPQEVGGFLFGRGFMSAGSAGRNCSLTTPAPMRRVVAHAQQRAQGEQPAAIAWPAQRSAPLIQTARRLLRMAARSRRTAPVGLARGRRSTSGVRKVALRS